MSKAQEGGRIAFQGELGANSHEACSSFFPDYEPVPQTPIEVAMDDWALATVSDLEDRTRVRGVAGAVSSTKARRRRRSAVADASYAPVGTLHRVSAGSTATRPHAQTKGMRALAWGVVASAVLVIVLLATVTLVLVKASNAGIPQVTDIAATTTSRSVVFSWADPGLAVDDSYQVTTSDGRSSLQSATKFPVDAKAGDRVCITVAVNRAGKVGQASSEKCVDFTG